MRVYAPTTIAGLAELHETGTLTASPDRYVPDGDGEEQEYAALVAAAADAADLAAGGRRVVVVAELPDGADPDADVPLRHVVAVHADEAEGADPEDDLGWFATQEIGAVLGH